MASVEGERKKKREKKNLEFEVALRPRDPLLAGDFFSARGEKKRLPVWGEGTRCCKSKEDAMNDYITKVKQLQEEAAAAA
ncbi:hypothetical protein BHE74_00021621 [Ensete ventricosum]|nr:hypothetical protein GW17_00039201 [Ensete ventricosum]RWW70683.1 hypothetical protein BHE74_00021621 [Ensete ventricosum]RZS20744.1 hypothetical protein BHM03_00053292 [Ensete ventricosum]